ncbi:MAG: stage III sporulation protein AF [Actinobacteria bacterium]|nr:stage III sporulation protein AF [Actinomycetota bacterium]
METLRALVQNLVIIVILAVLLEMMLPGGEMRRYTKMVLGLMVIVAVIQAVNGLSGGGLFKEIEEYAWRDESSGGQRLDIMERGKSLDEENKRRAMERYRYGVEKQVAGLAGLDSRINLSGTEVIVQDDPSKKDYGRISEINLVFGRGGSDSRQVRPVDTVSVNAGDKNTGPADGDGLPPEKMEAARSAADKVASFYNLSPDQVKVIFK